MSSSSRRTAMTRPTEWAAPSSSCALEERRLLLRRRLRRPSLRAHRHGITRDQRMAEFADVMRALGCEGHRPRLSRTRRAWTRYRSPTSSLRSSACRTTSSRHLVHDRAVVPPGPSRRLRGGAGGGATDSRALYRDRSSATSCRPTAAIRGSGTSRRTSTRTSAAHLEQKLAACALYNRRFALPGMLSLDAIRRFAQTRGFESRATPPSASRSCASSDDR